MSCDVVTTTCVVEFALHFNISSLLLYLLSKHLAVQTQQQKHYKGVKYVQSYNKDIRRCSGVFIIDFDHIPHFSLVSIVDFEHVNNGWVVDVTLRLTVVTYFCKGSIKNV